MAGILWMVFGLLQIRWSAPYLASDGGERFKRLPERRAQILQEIFATGVHDFLLVAGLATNLLGLFFGLVSSSLLGAIFSGAAVVALVFGLALRRRARPIVLAAFQESGLKPLTARETSEKRQLRQKQFGVAALTGFVLGETARFFADRQGIAWLDAVSAGAMLFAFVAVGALIWATAWVYGDETASR